MWWVTISNFLSASSTYFDFNAIKLWVYFENCIGSADSAHIHSNSKIVICYKDTWMNVHFSSFNCHWHWHWHCSYPYLLWTMKSHGHSFSYSNIIISRKKNRSKNIQIQIIFVVEHSFELVLQWKPIDFC